MRANYPAALVGDAAGVEGVDDVDLESDVFELADFGVVGKDVLLAQFTASMERPDLMERLAEITYPVLIVGATGDQLVNPEDLREMQRHLPDARLNLHDGTGHMIPLEAPQALAADILAFHRPA